MTKQPESAVELFKKTYEWKLLNDHDSVFSGAMENFIRQALTQAHQAGIDEAVEIVEHKKEEFENDELAILAGMQDIKVNAADEILEALQDK